MVNEKNPITDYIQKTKHEAPERSRERFYLIKAVERSRALFRPVSERISYGTSTASYMRDLKIGLISRTIQYGATPELDGKVVELTSYMPTLRASRQRLADHYQILVPGSLEEIERARVKILEDIVDLCEGGANLICLNELGYPAFSCPHSSHLSKQIRQLLLSGDKEFRRNIQNTSDRYNTIIVCGSYHDPRDLYNKAVIFFPSRKSSIEHLKLTSAKSPNVGEVIRTPPDPYFPLYKTEYGTIGVLICLDAFDLNMFFRQLHFGLPSNEEKPPDIIFVPSYTKRSLGDACEALSYFSRSVVIYCNTTNAEFNAVYCAGEEVDRKPDVEKRIVSLDWAERDRMILDAEKNQDSGIFSGIVGTYTGQQK